MSDERDESLDYLQRHNNDAAAAARDIVRNGSNAVRQYITIVGLMRLLAEERRKNRRLLEHRVIPAFISTPSAPAARVRLSRGNERRLIGQAREFFAEWKIGSMSMAEMTKENLLAEARKERRKANGHLFDATFYEHLAAPMSPGQLVPDYWQTPRAVAFLRDELWRRQESGEAIAVVGESRPGV